MKVLIIFRVLTFGGYSFGQVFTTKNGVVVVTNSQTQAQVIRVASGLRIGMREEDASWVLATNQLYSTVRNGAYLRQWRQENLCLIADSSVPRIEPVL